MEQSLLKSLITIFSETAKPSNGDDKEVKDVKEENGDVKDVRSIVFHEWF